MELYNAVMTRGVGENTLPLALNTLIGPLVGRFNAEVAPKLLARCDFEPVPSGSRNLSAFRSRVSALIEYSLINLLAEFLDRDTADRLHVTHNVTNQFGDFFVRGEGWEPLLRLDVKTLHNESDEASARFDLPTEQVAPLDDYLLYVAWRWTDGLTDDQAVVYPTLIDAVFIPAIDVAEERDLRQTLMGGSFGSAGQALSKSGEPDSNFGKIDRLVFVDRRSDPSLHPLLVRLLAIVAAAAPTKPTAKQGARRAT